MKKTIVCVCMGIAVFVLTSQSSVVISADSMAKGRAVIAGTTESSPIEGVVNFTESENGLIVEAQISNVSGHGKRGFHIHQNGSCDDGGKAAGGHFNPAQTQHGLLTKDGLENSHAGDMGNITIGEDGSGSLSLVLPDVGLVNGVFNVAGRAIILHAEEDDFGQPTGNAGARIGCGTIVITGE